MQENTVNTMPWFFEKVGWKYGENVKESLLQNKTAAPSVIMPDKLKKAEYESLDF